jgi:hypothetical protein
MVFVGLAFIVGCGSQPQQAQETPPQSPLTEAMILRDAQSRRASSYDRTGGNADWQMFDPGQTLALAELNGAGCIKHFYWTYIIGEENTRERLFRDMILRMYWDGEELPSVECPIGDFFGVSNCMLRPIRSLVLVINPGTGATPVSWGLNSYFPMPFSNGARVEVTNEAEVPLGIWYHIDYETYPKPPQWLEDAGRFHAQFRRTKTTAVAAPGGLNTTGEENYVILEAAGRGSLAGYMLSVDNVTGGWWGEGDDMVFIDGESWPPSFHGTGSEEIFGGGAGPNVEYSGPYTGFHLVENRLDDAWFGKNGMYRFFVHDPIRFQESIRVTIEHGHANDLANDYSSVAYWYQEEPHAPFPALPPPEERAVIKPPPVTYVEGAIEAEALLGTASSSGDPLRSLRFPGEWSAGRFLWYLGDAPDDFVSIQVPVEADGTYDVVMYLTKASDFGSFQLKVDGKDLGEPFDAYNGEGGMVATHVIRAEEVKFGTLNLTAGDHTFEFRLVGKNEAATSYMVGVDCIVLRRH